MIRKLCEQAVWLVWELVLKIKEHFTGKEVTVLNATKRHRTMERCVRW